MRQSLIQAKRALNHMKSRVLAFQQCLPLNQQPQIIKETLQEGENGSKLGIYGKVRLQSYEYKKKGPGHLRCGLLLLIQEQVQRVQ